MSAQRGYRLTDVRPGYARVVREDGEHIGEVKFCTPGWGVYSAKLGVALFSWKISSQRTRRLAVAALIEADMKAWEIR